VLSACQYIGRGGYPANYPVIQGNNPQNVLMRGGSVIVNPLECVLAGPDYSGEKILTADVDPGEIAEGKFDLSPSTNRVRSDDSARCPIHFPRQDIRRPGPPCSRLSDECSPAGGSKSDRKRQSSCVHASYLKKVNFND
jgi:nitrilase